MNPLWFDVAVGAILLYAVIRGALQGLVWQLAAIAAIVLCFAFSESVSILVAPSIDLEPPLNRWVAMLGLYLLATLACFGVAWKIHDVLEKWKLKHVDRQLGAAFGFLKGATFALVALFFVVTLSKPARETALRSHSGLAAAIVMEKLHAVMPDELHDVIHPYIHQLDDAKHAHARDESGEHHHDHDTHHSGDSHDAPDAESDLQSDELLPDDPRSIFDRGVPLGIPKSDDDSQFDAVQELESKTDGRDTSAADKSATRPTDSPRN